MELLQKLAVGFRSVLPLGVILGAFLYTFAILHQPCFLPIAVRLPNIGKPRASYKRGSVTPC